MTQQSAWRIRPATDADRDFLVSLAPRLTIGIPPWRDAQAMLAAVRRWLLDDLDRKGPDSTVLIAESPDSMPVDAATIGRSKHFTGVEQAELGELAVIAEREGQGIASALLTAAEGWARAHSLRFIALGTGTANTHARAFYAHHGYAEEDIRLVKVLDAE